MALQRLTAGLDHLKANRNIITPRPKAGTSQSANLAFVEGTKEPPLWIKTLGNLIDEQARQYGIRTAVVVPWQSVRLSYRRLCERSKILANALLKAGLQHGDCVGIMAGNRFEYIEVFLGGARIGCPVVVLNNTYTPHELRNAVSQSSCKILFLAQTIGPRDLNPHLQAVMAEAHLHGALPELRQVILLGDFSETSKESRMQSYADFTSETGPGNEATLILAEQVVVPSDLLNLQFTSGTTGAPKAAMLTHINLLNNGRFIGDAMRLTPDDIVCCPPPLFHCFGLVLGFLASFSHGSSIVFPSDAFKADLALDALMAEKCTALLGVPTMFIAEMEANEKKRYVPRTIRTGLAAGSAVPIAVMNELRSKMGVEGMLIAYGMTETSPATFIASLDDTPEIRATTLGKIMPHSAAKIIGKQGQVLKRGERGELCTSGYGLQKGYWKNPAKTREVMKRDENGVLWMHTGDECTIDSDGYCRITGRIKDIIIRGGENLFPIEIEEQLLAHPAIAEASVVGLADSKYGEVVGAFLKSPGVVARPKHDEIRAWVGSRLGKPKTPQHIFWIGDAGVGEDFPKTGSGKHQKHILRALGDTLVEHSLARAKL